MGTIKTTNIEPIATNGTVTLGSSGDTFTVPSGVTLTNFPDNKPSFAVRNDGDQSVSSATWTQLTFDTELNDSDSAFASNTFTVPSGKGGLYTFFWGIHGVQGLDAGELVQLGIYINGVRSDFSDNRLTSAATDTEFKFSANFQTNLSPADTVKAYVFQNEGASQNVTDATFAGFRIIPT